VKNRFYVKINLMESARGLDAAKDDFLVLASELNCDSAEVDYLSLILNKLSDQASEGLIKITTNANANNNAGENIWQSFKIELNAILDNYLFSDLDDVFSVGVEEEKELLEMIENMLISQSEGLSALDNISDENQGELF